LSEAGVDGLEDVFEHGRRPWGDVSEGEIITENGLRREPLPVALCILLAMSRLSNLLPALGHRNFRLFYAGFVVSLLGSWMQRVALSWLVLELTDSAFYVGLVDAVSMLPVLFFTLWAGVVADRFPRRGIVLVTQSGAMVFSAILAVLVFAGAITVWHILVLATLIGLTHAFDIPARHALMVDLVGKGDLTNAIALNSSAFNATRVVGPAIAGGIIGVVGVAMCFVLNSVSFLAVIGALLLLRLPPFKRREGLRSPWKDLREGFRYITSDVRSSTLVLNIAAFSIFGVPVFVLMPVMTRDVLGLGADAFGWMMSAVGVGALTGALGLAVFGHRLPRGRLLSIAAAAFGVFDVAFALSRSLPVSLVALVMLGFSMITMTALTNTLLQTIAPDELRGRVVAFYAWAFLGIAPFGALQAGWIAERIGTPNALAIGGTVCVVAAALLLLRSREVMTTR
jgi:MFS family permease